MEIAQSKTVSVKDRIEAMYFLRQIYEDELAVFLSGPSSWLIKEAGSSTSMTTDVSREDLLRNRMPSSSLETRARWPCYEDRAAYDKSNAEF